MHGRLATIPIGFSCWHLGGVSILTEMHGVLGARKAGGRIWHESWLTEGRQERNKIRVRKRYVLEIKKSFHYWRELKMDAKKRRKGGNKKLATFSLLLLCLSAARSQRSSVLHADAFPLLTYTTMQGASFSCFLIFILRHTSVDIAQDLLYARLCKLHHAQLSLHQQACRQDQ